MYNTILGVVLVVFASLSAHAQFYTVTKMTPERVIEQYSATHIADTLSVTKEMSQTEADSTAKVAIKEPKLQNDSVGRIRYRKTSVKKEEIPPMQKVDARLPELTVANLYEEILRNGIKHPKIVLAQAILETGWFKSSVCRNKHNLFGLTNPRTKTYYEFNHWTESVRAYYTKVQYKYKGGNYFKWLRELPYAEEPGYTRALIKILKQI